MLQSCVSYNPHARQAITTPHYSSVETNRSKNIQVLISPSLQYSLSGLSPVSPTYPIFPFKSKCLFGRACIDATKTKFCTSALSAYSMKRAFRQAAMISAIILQPSKLHPQFANFSQAPKTRKPFEQKNRIGSKDNTNGTPENAVSSRNRGLGTLESSCHRSQNDKHLPLHSVHYHDTAAISFLQNNLNLIPSEPWDRPWGIVPRQ